MQAAAQTWASWSLHPRARRHVFLFSDFGCRSPCTTTSPILDMGSMMMIDEWPTAPCFAQIIPVVVVVVVAYRCPPRTLAKHRHPALSLLSRNASESFFKVSLRGILSRWTSEVGFPLRANEAKRNEMKKELLPLGGPHERWHCCIVKQIDRQTERRDEMMKELSREAIQEKNVAWCDRKPANKSLFLYALSPLFLPCIYVRCTYVRSLMLLILFFLLFFFCD